MSEVDAVADPLFQSSVVGETQLSMLKDDIIAWTELLEPFRWPQLLGIICTASLEQ